jgi:hypothetical protein
MRNFTDGPTEESYVTISSCEGQNYVKFFVQPLCYSGILINRTRKYYLLCEDCVVNHLKSVFVMFEA